MTNAAVSRWPGLAGLKLQPIQIERAVWGKVHGQSSDYRWIVRSHDLTLDPTFHESLSLGSEDRPQDAVCWRVLKDRFVAMRIYPSRARDAAGRTGFLEKHLLILRRHNEIPAALAAMVLLPRVAQLGDEVWWPYHDSRDWSRSDFVLKLESRENRTITASRDELRNQIEVGTAELKEKVGPDQLASMYQTWFDGLRPAVLSNLDQPLSPEALAALLLPIQREKADQLSLAGWIPSFRVQTQDIGNWDLMICPHELVPVAEGLKSEPSEMATATVLNLIQAKPLTGNEDQPGQKPSVLSRPIEVTAVSEPPAVTADLLQRVESWRKEWDHRLPRPGRLLPLTENPAIPQRLFNFACGVDERWTSTDELKSCISKGNLTPAIFGRLIEEVRAFRPSDVHVGQWDKKIELLKKVFDDLSSSLKS